MIQKTILSEIHALSKKQHINNKVIKQFEELLSKNPVIKSEGALRHMCTFFLPIHLKSKSIYLGHHKKAGDWIPPGGHMEKGELPLDTAKREFFEELNYHITNEPITFFNISVKHIGRDEVGCNAHFDLWHFVEMKGTVAFDFLKKEYFDAKWFPAREGLNRIEKNPDFKELLGKLVDRIM